MEGHSLADDGAHNVFERVLHGPSSALALPATESCAVVGYLET
jgi:hypothetical protein